jgi:c-di-GMP-binding flagellar brake protein YcgR
MQVDSDTILNSISDEEQAQLIKELEKNTPEEIRRRRAHFRFSIKAAVTLQPGNASQLKAFKVQGMTRDISSGGLGALFPIPVCVGDVYRLSFDPSQLDLPLTFARCVSCAMVREGAYNAGFKFFSTITLPKNMSASKENDQA